MPKRIKLTSRFMKNPPNSRRVMRPSRYCNPFPVIGEPCKEANPTNNSPDNLMSLCHSCHSRKTVAHDGAFGRGKSGG